MRVLIVIDEYPWPARTGYRLRVDRVVRTLAADAEVDLLIAVFDAADAGATPVPDDVRLRRHEVVIAGPLRQSSLRRTARWLLGGEPRALGWRDWSAPREALGRWADRPYDAVWFSHAGTYAALADAVDAPHVVDLDNLNSYMLRHRRLGMRHRRPGSVRGWAGAAARRAADMLDERRWARLERRVADRAAAVVVCSALDRDRLNRPTARVVENCYEPQDSSPPRPAERSAPVLLLVGVMTYEPNRDAALFFAREVLPLVRAAVPGAELRVVGRYGAEPAVAPLRALPGVKVIGEVPEIGAELRAADVAVVPIRFGGGTRIKILEALAHGLPVVSTTVGAEGLEVVDGRHVLVADDPRGLATACERLLGDPDLRAALASTGQELWAEKYRWSSIAPTIKAVVHEAAGR